MASNPEKTKGKERLKWAVIVGLGALALASAL